MKQEHDHDRKIRESEIETKGERASQRLIHEVYYKFEREPNKQHLVYSLIAGDYDWKLLENSPHNAMLRLHPPGGSITVFVYFKRDENTPDLEWNEIYRKLPIRRI